MWLSVRLLLLLVAVLAVAGCGFRPLYGGGQGGAVNAHLAAISVAPIPDRSGQIVRNALEHRLSAGRQSPPAYRLEVDLIESIEELGVRRDLTSARANIRIQATWRLLNEGKLVRSGVTDAVSSYNILDQRQYATITSQQDSRARAAEQVADRIVRQLAVFFSRGA